MRMPRLPIVALVFTSLTACSPDAKTPVLGPSDALQQRGAACANVQGTVSGNAFEIWGLHFAGDLAGPGTLLAAPELNPRGGGAIHVATLHAISTTSGVIFTEDKGVLAPVAPPVYRLINRYTVTGGTDAYEGATGSIHVNALVDLSTGELNGRYHGQLCR
jgi:hypothetical protein